MYVEHRDRLCPNVSAVHYQFLKLQNVRHDYRNGQSETVIRGAHEVWSQVRPVTVTIENSKSIMLTRNILHALA